MSKAISRRNFLLATGAVGAAGLLAACGGSSASSTASSAASSEAPAASADDSLALSDGPVNLSISWWGGDSRHEAYQNAIKEFESEHSNISIEPTFAAWSGWEEKMAAAFIAGNAQDVCQVNWNWLYNYSADGSKFEHHHQVPGPDPVRSGCSGCLLRGKQPAVRACFHDRPYLLLEHDHL